MERANHNEFQLGGPAMWIGIAAGAAVVLGIALSRRKKSRWEIARDYGRQLAERSTDLAGSAKQMVDKVRTVVRDEGRKVVDDAGDLWTRGRKVVGH